MDPYVGPRPFERDEAELFFGRLGETRLAVSMVLSSRVVLLYALSGAGKTSLLNAAVAPALERDDYFEVLAPPRVRGPNLEGRSTEDVNPFVAGVLAHWTSEPARSVTALLGQRPHSIGPDGFPRPRAIIVDQLEEVFTAHPDHWRERGELFRQLADALEHDPLLRVILAIREDYLAQLEPFRELLPGRLENRLRLELLDPAAAQEAVTGPVRATARRFAEGVAERLVRDLRTTAITEDGGRRREFEGQYIEPVQLQLACSALWRDLPPDVSEITDDHLRRFGDVDQVLTDFYDEAIAAAAQAAATEERQLRERFTDTFITSMHTRGTAYQSGDRVGMMPLAAVEQLERRRLLRSEWRANARWFELTHDRLIAPIERSNPAALVRTVSDLGRVVRGALGALGGVLVAVIPATLLAAATRDAFAPGTLVAAAAYWAMLSALVFACAALGWALATAPSTWRRRTAAAFAIGGAVGATAGALWFWTTDDGPPQVVLFALVGAVVGRAGIVAPGGRAAAAAAAGGGALAGIVVWNVYFASLVWEALITHFQVVGAAWLPELARAGRRAAAGESLTARWRSRTPRLVLVLAAVILATGIVAAIALRQARTAERERTQVLSRSLAAQSADVANADVAALLTVEAYHGSPTREAVDAMVAALTRLQPTIRARVGQVVSVAVTPDGRIVAASGTSGIVRLFDIATRRLVSTTSRQIGTAQSVAFAPDGSVFASVGEDGAIRVSTRDGRLRLVLRDTGPLFSVDFDASGRRLAAGGATGLSVWDVPRGVEIARVGSRRIASVSFSPSGPTLAAGSNGGSVRLWRVSRGLDLLEVRRGARGGVFSVAFRPDGGLLAAAGADAAIRLWRLDQQRAATVLRGHTGSVFSIDFNPDGDLLASAGDDGTVRLWRPETRARSAVLRGFTGSVLSVVFSPDGRSVVSGGADGTVRLLDQVLWTGDPAALEAAICARVNRSLTPAEWDRFVPGDPYRKTCD
jgi:WD40 repeat protein